MGSCMSSKSKKGVLASAQSNAPTKLKTRLLGSKMEKKTKIYRGTATSFGFKKPVVMKNSTNSNSSNSTSIPLVQEKFDETEELVIPATTRSGTPRLARQRKETVPTNRFGFRSPTAHSRIRPLDGRGALATAEEPKQVPSMLPVPRSHQSRIQQFPVRLATAAAHYPPRTSSNDKNAKTAANNTARYRSRSENGGSSASSVNDADSGVGSQKSGGEVEIEQLDCSPSARNRLRNVHKARPMEMIFPGGKENKFVLRDLKDSIEVTEIMPLELPALPLAKRLPQDQGLVRERAKAYTRQISRGTNSGSSEDDEGIEDESGEEKQYRDRVLSEKEERGVVGAGEEAAEADDLWGHGEAMVGEEDIPCGQNMDSDVGCQEMTPPLRSVLLSIEDHTFAALAARSKTTLLEEESYPELPDFQICPSLSSSSPITSPNTSQAPPQLKNSDDSPGSPGTPTHTSNSLSLSSDIRDRDFIDDEICDQPGLVYDNLTANSSGNTLVPDEPSPKVIKPLTAVGNLTLDCSSTHHSSVGTLSPCESITSDDLIMDYDLSNVEDDHRYYYRLDTSSLDLALDEVSAQEAEHTVQELASLLTAQPELMNGVRATRQLRSRVGSSGSGADSPRSLDTPRLRSGSALSSPLRSSRQGTSSPGEDISEDSGIRVQRGMYQSMYQDVINIKALALRLSRALQQSETENTHETSQNNGFYNSSSDVEVDKKEVCQQEMILDLQRQVVFLQSQVEEKDRTIRSLQVTQPPEPRGQVETCNAATQTERIRPLSTGPILSTQPDAGGCSLVSSMNEPVRLQPPPNTRPVSRLPQWRRPTSPSCDQHKSSSTVRKQT